MKRHPKNNNLKLFFGESYEGFDVQHRYAPLVEEYLSRTLYVARLALLQHRKTFAFRVDLRFPTNQLIDDAQTNKPLERFFKSLRAKIEHKRLLREKKSGHAHGTAVSHIWCREIGKHGVPHYHLAILLNRDAFFKLGKFKIGRKNLFNLLVEAWSSALKLPVEDMDGLVHIPKKHGYKLTSDDRDAFNDFFHRVSYLCKAETKHFGDGVHSFGTSRI
ncbi:MAG: inovirus Gp2 family protein [Propionivibrio sp.]